METPVMSATTHKHTNRLAEATNPYLLQHAHYRVERYEWRLDDDRPRRSGGAARVVRSGHGSHPAIRCETMKQASSPVGSG